MAKFNLLDGVYATIDNKGGSEDKVKIDMTQKKRGTDKKIS